MSLSELLSEGNHSLLEHLSVGIRSWVGQQVMCVDGNCLAPLLLCLSARHLALHVHDDSKVVSCLTAASVTSACVRTTLSVIDRWEKSCCSDYYASARTWPASTRRWCTPAGASASRATTESTKSDVFGRRR